MTTQYVEDARTGFFWMHDVIMDHYAKEIGVYGVSVYALLCRRSNAKKRCWPSLKGMAEDLGISRRKLVYTLDDLERRRLIKREQRDVNGKQTSNVYTLLPPPVGVHEVHPPSACDAPPLVHEVHPKEYTEEGIHNEGGASERDSGEVRYLDDATQEIVEQLLGVKNWDKNEAETITYVTKAKNAFAHVDLVTLARIFAFKVNTDAKLKYMQPSRAFSNWASREKPEPKPRITKPTQYTPAQRAGFARVLAEQEERRKRQLAEFLEPDVGEEVS